MGERVRLAMLDRIAQITLNRPDTYQALDLPTARDLAMILLKLTSDQAADGVVITDVGKAFSAGGTLQSLEVAVGPWTLDGLQPGAWRAVRCPRNHQELRRLRQGGEDQHPLGQYQSRGHMGD